MRRASQILTLVGLVLTLGAVTADAQFGIRRPRPGPDFHVEIGYDQWRPTPNLVIATGGSPDIDLSRTFQLPQDRMHVWHGTIRPALKHKIRIDYIPMRYDQDAIVNETIEFGGQLYTVNAPANADIDWVLIRAGYEYDLISGAGGFVGVIAELNYNTITTVLSSSAVGASTTIDTTVPIPAFGLALGGTLIPRFLSVTGEVTGFKVPSREDFQGRFVDGQVYATLQLGRNFGVRAGYRALNVRYLVEDDRGRLKMQGPFVGAQLRF